MKKIKALVLLFLVALCSLIKPNTVRASHAAGGEIIYEWVADSTYRVFFKFYRDCSGIPANSSETLCMSSTCSTTQYSIPMSLWTGTLPSGLSNGSPVSAGCSQYPNKCQQPSSILPGYQEWWYSTMVTMPSKCNFWRFSVSISARNSSQNIAATNLYIETTFNNKLFEGNSSPYFSIKPIPYCCVNLPYSYNNGAIDPNGDSLVTDLIRPLDGTSCGPGVAITWNSASPPYSLPSNPFQTNNSFSTVAATGQMTFTPTLTGAHTMTTRVTEYRNGILIGYIMRDIQVQVLTCSTVAPYMVDTAYNVVGGATGVLGRVEACVGQDIQFDFHIKHSDPTAIFLLEDNHAASIPASIITYTNQRTDSVHGHFSWTPTLLDIGLKQLIVTAKDSTCRPPGIMLYYTKSYSVYVWPPVKTVNDTSVCPGETAYLNATGGGNYLWSVLPGGSPITSLSCTTCISPVATPILTTSYVVLSQKTSFCNNNRDTVIVSVLPGLVFSKLVDTTTCPQNSVTLDLKPVPPAGVKYKYKWSPITFLNNDTVSNPITTPTSPITYRVTIMSSGNSCKAYDTVVVDVLSGFKIITPDTVVCNGTSFDINVTGDSRYAYEWTSDNQLPGCFSSTTKINPTVTPAPSQETHKYQLRATYGQCKPDSQIITIEVEPVPVVSVSDDASMCEGDTMKLIGNIIPSTYPFDLLWYPGASLNNSKVSTPVFTAQQTTTLSLTAASLKAKCKSSDTVVLTVYPSKFVTTKGDTAICPGNKTQLFAIGGGIKSISWYPAFNMSDKLISNPYVWPTTTTIYTVYAKDTNSCLDTADVKVTVRPSAIVYMPHEVTIYPGEFYKIEPSTNCTYFSWFPKLGLSNSAISNPIAQPVYSTKYVTIATTESGCTTKDSINIIVDPNSIINMPNAFTPGSEPNSTLKINYRGTIILSDFSIYNRYGQLIYRSIDPNKGWDGTFNGQPQPMGVYVYSVQGITNSGHKFNKQGNITLIR